MNPESLNHPEVNWASMPATPDMMKEVIKDGNQPLIDQVIAANQAQHEELARLRVRQVAALERLARSLSFFAMKEGSGMGVFGV